MMKLMSEILTHVPSAQASGPADIAVNALEIDSRQVQHGACFIAIKGTITDGHQFIETAIVNGAVAIICETLPQTLKKEVLYVLVKESASAAGVMAHAFYGSVTNTVVLAGVTGTNGKTTVATLLYKLFTALGYTCGLISTVQNRVGDTILESTHTTPDAISLNKLLAHMKEQGCSHVFMEVSSHALDQKRVSGLVFAGGIFTNITHDHLDYHHTFDAYIKVKKSFFDHLPSKAFALTNADDKRGLVMLQNTAAKKYVYSLRDMADFKGRILDNNLLGLHMIINEVEVHFRLIGAFNAYNLLAAYGAAVCLGMDKELVLQQLSLLEGAEGRFDPVVSRKEHIMAIIDYAHTPDALLNVLATIKNIRTDQQQIITVIGCGGNRDKTKRPEMANVACEYSNRVVFTSDNPRYEVPEDIIKDMEAGVPLTAKKKCISITERKEAIKAAIVLAEEKDIILVAGKGHEKYQEVKGVKNDFDDKKVVVEMFELLEK